MIPYGRQDISAADVEAVIEVLRSDFLTQGPAVPTFERTVATYSGSDYAVAANSATSALHIACLALGVGPGARVWTSPITFVASANCALYCGADVDFVDIDSRTFNMDVEALAEKLETAARDNRLPNVVIPVHFAGQSCDMEGIDALRKQYGFRVIEDASHAIGGRLGGEPVGSCRWSDVTIFSFHPVKIVTSAEGGMAVTNDRALARRMQLFRSHGITRDPEQMTREADGPWYYQQVALGFNYRITDLQAALGTSQMRRIDDFVARRHALVRRYDEALSGLPLITPWQHPKTYSAFHLYVIRMREASERNRVFRELRDAGVGVNVHYIPVYLQPYYEQLGFSSGYCPEAERCYSEAITLPLFATLTAAQQQHVIESLAAALNR